jgi:hypothetical protein
VPTDGDGDGAAPAADVVIRSGELELHARGAVELAAGDRVVAYLRPENIDVLEDGQTPTKPNVVEGEVERVVFEGPTVQLRIRVGDRPLRVDVGGGRRLTLADGVRRVRVEFADLTVIPAPRADA